VFRVIIGPTGVHNRQHFHYIKSLDIDEDVKSIIEYKLKETKKFYEFKSKPFETKKDNYEK